LAIIGGYEFWSFDTRGWFQIKAPKLAISNNGTSATVNARLGPWNLEHREVRGHFLQLSWRKWIAAWSDGQALRQGSGRLLARG
jgi:hypothetical protein